MAYKKRRYYLYLIILYLFIYSPDIFFLRGFLNPGNLVLYSSFVYFLIHPKIFKHHIHNFKREFFFFSAILAFVLMRNLGEPNYPFTMQSILAFMKLFVVVPFLMFYAWKNKFYSEAELIKSFLLVGTVASIITTICIIFPQINSYLKDQVIQLEIVGVDSAIMEYRGFGFANSLSSHYGYVQGFIAGLGCFYLKDNKWFLFFIPFVILSALVNARTGVIVVFVGILLSVITTKKSYAIAIILFALILLPNLEAILSSIGLSEETLVWLLGFQDEIEAVAQSGSLGSSSTAETLFGEMAVLPDGISQWLIGRGYDIFHGGIGINNSDVGWYRQLNYGGLVYISLFYGAVLYILLNLLRHHHFTYMMYFLCVFLVLNTKSSIYPLYTIFSVMMFLYYIYILGGSEGYFRKVVKLTK